MHFPFVVQELYPKQSFFFHFVYRTRLRADCLYYKTLNWKEEKKFVVCKYCMC